MRTLARTSFSVLVAALLCAPIFAAGASKDLEKTPQVKAYRALLKTIDAGDYEAYKKGMAAESAKGMDQQMKDSGMDAKKGMAFLKAMSPTDLKLTSLKVDGKKATLLATGKVDGEINYGTIEMAEEDGQWKVVRQSWTNKK
ncbi:MAG TPA: polymer-forming cytoskeletal protein [Thermoanaerobaculia bacterium]